MTQAMSMSCAIISTVSANVFIGRHLVVGHWIKRIYLTKCVKGRRKSGASLHVQATNLFNFMAKGRKERELSLSLHAISDVR